MRYKNSMQALNKLHKWATRKICSLIEWVCPYLHPEVVPEPLLPLWEDFQRQLPVDGVYWFCYKYQGDRDWVGPLMVEVKNGAFGEIPHIGAGHWFLKLKDYQNGILLAKWYLTYRPQPPTE